MCEVYVGVTRVKVVYEPLEAVFRAGPNAETVIDEAFPHERLYWIYVDKVIFEFAHANISISGSHFSAHTGACCLDVVHAIKLEIVSGQYKLHELNW